jgi:phage replication O-like protein O
MNDYKEKEPYTKIPNELLENLAKVALSDYEQRIIFAVILKTYRYQNVGKKNWRHDFISLSQIMNITGITKKQNVSKHLIRLKKRKIIIGIPGRKIGINTVYGEWIMSSKEMTEIGNPVRLKKSSDYINGVIQIDDKNNLDRVPHNKKLLQNEKEILEGSKAMEAKKKIEKILFKNKGIKSLDEIIKTDSNF